MKARAEPYLMPDPGAVDHGGWHLRTLAGEEPLGADVLHWDYQTHLSLVAAVSVDRRSILDTCMLGDDTALDVQVFAHSSHTNARMLITSVPVPAQDSYDLAVEAELPGDTLGGRLAIDTLVVAQRPVPLGPISAHRQGSILWRQRHHTHLEGEGSRFPTDAFSFAVVFPDAKNAMWRLSIDDSDPERSFMASVRLALNTDSPAVQALLAGEAGDPLVGMIRWDVLRQLIFLGLRSDWLDDVRSDPEDPSLAGVVTAAIRAVFPHDPPTAVRARLIQTPHAVESAIQNHERLAR